MHGGVIDYKVKRIVTIINTEFHLWIDGGIVRGILKAAALQLYAGGRPQENTRILKKARIFKTVFILPIPRQFFHSNFFLEDLWAT